MYIFDNLLTLPHRKRNMKPMTIFALQQDKSYSNVEVLHWMWINPKQDVIIAIDPFDNCVARALFCPSPILIIRRLGAFYIVNASNHFSLYLNNELLVENVEYPLKVDDQIMYNIRGGLWRIKEIPLSELKIDRKDKHLLAAVLDLALPYCTSYYETVMNPSLGFPAMHPNRLLGQSYVVFRGNRDKRILSFQRIGILPMVRISDAMRFKGNLKKYLTHPLLGGVILKLMSKFSVAMIKDAIRQCVVGEYAIVHIPEFDGEPRPPPPPMVCRKPLWRYSRFVTQICSPQIRVWAHYTYYMRPAKSGQMIRLQLDPETNTVNIKPVPKEHLEAIEDAMRHHCRRRLIMRSEIQTSTTQLIQEEPDRDSANEDVIPCKKRKLSKKKNKFQKRNNVKHLKIKSNSRESRWIQTSDNGQTVFTLRKPENVMVLPRPAKIDFPKKVYKKQPNHQMQAVVDDCQDEQCSSSDKCESLEVMPKAAVAPNYVKSVTVNDKKYVYISSSYLMQWRNMGSLLSNPMSFPKLSTRYIFDVNLWARLQRKPRNVLPIGPALNDKDNEILPKRAKKKTRVFETTFAFAPSSYVVLKLVERDGNKQTKKTFKLLSKLFGDNSKRAAIRKLLKKRHEKRQQFQSVFL